MTGKGVNVAEPVSTPSVKIYELLPGLGIAVEPMSVSGGEQKGNHREYTMTFQAYVVKRDERGEWQPVET